MNISPPNYVKDCLSNWFPHAEREIDCQIATVSNNQPHLRTMMLYDITDEGNLVFLTNTKSNKWRELQHNQNVAVCFLNMEYGQIIAEGSVQLKAYSIDNDNTSKYWKLLPEVWREIYVSKTENLSAKDTIPDTFGVIFIIPRLWEILLINKDNYIKSTRKRFQLIKGNWTVHELIPE